MLAYATCSENKYINSIKIFGSCVLEDPLLEDTVNDEEKNKHFPSQMLNPRNKMP
jgi:hypothetical protein